MSKVFAQITMSLDGYATGPNVSVDNPLGDGGEQLHYWLFGDGKIEPTDIDRQVASEMFSNTGAFIVGKTMFDVGIGIWSEDGTFGMPCFVITHHPKPLLRKGPTTFLFVTDGIESALRQARTAVGNKDVCILGGPNILQQYLTTNALDELRLDIAPVLLRRGTPLFNEGNNPPAEFERISLLQSPLATHIVFRTVKHLTHGTPST
jgi:dihydrofolate reductase